MIITLCGSARFERHYIAWNVALTMAGHTVFSLTAFPSQMGGKNWYTETQKELLDGAHFRKIAASEAIVVLNVAAYIGESTLREIEYARALHKRVYALESWGEGLGIGPNHTKEHRDEMAGFLGGREFPASPIDTCTPYMSHIYGTELFGEGGTSIRHASIEHLRGYGF